MNACLLSFLIAATASSEKIISIIYRRLYLLDFSLRYECESNSAQITSVLKPEYSSNQGQNTRVLDPKYSSTRPEILEYLTQITRVLDPNYSSTAPDYLIPVPYNAFIRYIPAQNDM